jgi:hypothetical protein
MQAQHSPHQDARSTETQFDLFVPASNDNAEQELPQWQALPEEVRQELTNLLTRLFLAHASADHLP